MRISDWSSDVCSSDLGRRPPRTSCGGEPRPAWTPFPTPRATSTAGFQALRRLNPNTRKSLMGQTVPGGFDHGRNRSDARQCRTGDSSDHRSEEHTSELQSLMRNSYAVFRLKKQTNTLCNNYSE